MFGDDNLGVYGSDWIIWALDTITGVYQVVTLQTPLEQGRAYWIFSRSGGDRRLTMPQNCRMTPVAGSAACPVTEGCFSVPLLGTPDSSGPSSRWQMVGYPFAQPGAVSDTHVVTATGACSGGCLLGSADAEAIVDPAFWTYNGSEYELAEPGGSFTPWAGYWVRVLSGVGDSGAQLLFGQSGLQSN